MFYLCNLYDFFIVSETLRFPIFLKGCLMYASSPTDLKFLFFRSFMVYGVESNGVAFASVTTPHCITTIKHAIIF